MRFGAGLVAVAILGACADPEPSLPPIGPDHLSMLLVGQRSGDLALVAFDVAAPDFADQFDTQGLDQVGLLFYEETLEEIGLTEGPIPVALPGTLAHPPPPSASVSVGHQTEDGLEWVEAERLPDALRGAWISGAPPVTEACPEISVEELFLPPLENEATPSEWIGVAERFDSRTAIVATATGAWYFVTKDGFELIAELDENTPHGASYRTSDGRIWIAGCAGDEIFELVEERGRFSTVPEEDCFIEGWASNSEFVVRMEGPPAGAPFEIVTMTRGGRAVRHREDERPRELLNLRKAPIIFDWVNWVAPGVTAVTTVETEVTFVRGAGTAERVTPTWNEPGDAPIVFRGFPWEDGVLFTGSIGQLGASVILHYDPALDLWRVFAAREINGPIYGATPTSDGLAIAGDLGRIGWWTRETGFCFPEEMGPLDPEGRPAWDLRNFKGYDAVPINDNEMLVIGFEAPVRDINRMWWVTRSP